VKAARPTIGSASGEPAAPGDPEAEEDHIAGLHRREDLTKAEEADRVDDPR
jgi:hypothetical protein